MARGDDELRITNVHRQLFAVLVMEDRRWVARQVAGSTAFPGWAVSVVTVASLDTRQREHLEDRIRWRDQLRLELG